MSTPLDPGTLRALRDEAQLKEAMVGTHDSAKKWKSRAAWLQAKLDAMAQKPPGRRPTCTTDCLPEHDAHCDACINGWKEPPSPRIPPAESGEDLKLPAESAHPARIPPDLAGALKSWQVWFNQRYESYQTGGITYLRERELAAAIDAARKEGWL